MTDNKRFKHSEFQQDDGQYQYYGIEDTEKNYVYNVIGDGIYDISEELLINCLNELSEENKQLKEQNKELKSDNDIKFWKYQFMMKHHTNQLIMLELGKAIEEGYEVSNEFKQYLYDLKVQNEKNVEKAKRLGI